MYKIFNDEELQIIRDWMEVANEWMDGWTTALLKDMNGEDNDIREGGQGLPQIQARIRMLFPYEGEDQEDRKAEDLSVSYLSRVQTGDEAENKSKTKLLFKKTPFAKRKQMIGFGSVH